MDRQELLSLHTDIGTRATIDPTGPLRCRSTRTWRQRSAPQLLVKGRHTP